MKEAADYVLNFSIPPGPTGPTGPSSESNIYFASYGDAINLGYLQINQSKLIPSSTNIYTLGTDFVDVEAGIYEITYCGFLKKDRYKYTSDIKLSRYIKYGSNNPA